MKTPVLFLVFNRPDTTARVFEAIRQAQPERLYVAADGPRANRDGETERCAQVRDICTQIDWPCELKTLFREENLGCKYAVSGGINWFFEAEEEGIILEDDVLPDPSFFPFCEAMLERYRNHSNIAMVSAYTAIADEFPIKDSYFFTRYAHVWGWASWRRFWQQHYDVEISDWSSEKNNAETLRLKPKIAGFKAFWTNIFNRVESGKENTWDYPFQYAVFKSNSLCVSPNTLLAKNIGFGADATHTNTEVPEFMRVENLTPMRFPLKHPKKVKAKAWLEVADSIISYNMKPNRTFRKRWAKRVNAVANSIR